MNHRSDITFQIIKHAPIIVYLLIWTSVVILLQLGLYNIYSVSSYTYGLLFFASLLFVVSYITFTVYDKNFRVNISLSIDIEEKKLFNILIVFLGAAFMGNVLKSIEIAENFGGYSIYFENPLLVRRAVTNLEDFPIINTFQYRIGSYLTTSSLVASVYAGILYIKGTKYRLIILLSIGFSLITALITFSRFIFITFIVFFYFSALFTSFFSSEKERNRIKKKLLTITLLTLLSSVLVIILIYALRTFYSDEIGSLVTESIYYYFTGGVVAFDRYIELTQYPQLSLGASSFRSIVKWIDLFGLWPFAEAFKVHNSFIKVSPSLQLNTYTYLRALYEDFGFYGLSIGMIVWSYLAKTAMKVLAQSFSIYKLYFCVIMTFSLLMSFFAFYFQGLTNIILWLFCIIAVDYFYGGISKTSPANDLTGPLTAAPKVGYHL